MTFLAETYNVTQAYTHINVCNRTNVLSQPAIIRPLKRSSLCAENEGSPVLSVLLALNAGAFAQTEADFRVTLTEDGTGAVITKYTGAARAVKIPAVIQGMPVKEIREEAFANPRPYKNSLTSVTLPDGLLKIGNDAFRANDLLVSIAIPDSVTEIKDGAFSYCGLTNITFGKGFIELGYAVFFHTQLKSVTLPAWLQKIPNQMFRFCRNLSSVVIPEGVTEIEEDAFADCTSLTEIRLPASIKKIDTTAFAGCTSLVSVIIPDSVEMLEFSSIYNDEFRGCSKLSLASQARLRKLGYKGEF